MSEMHIRSTHKEYTVTFVDNCFVPLSHEVAKQGFVICDSQVYRLFKEQISRAVPGDRLLVLEAVEQNKSMQKCQEIIELLVEKKVRRDHRLIALGGGIVQDVTAFIASILYRGIGWVFFPTTLLAQGDSCIGSKTSINLGRMKNLVGNFYPPDDIYIDTAFLNTLAIADVQSGIGEMLHFYYYANSPLIKKLVANYKRVLEERHLLLEYIRESLAIKKSVIEIDEFDKGERNKFNYGHTFGHALETITDYGIRHGQAVTVGMDLANFLSWQLGFLAKDQFDEMRADLRVNFPEYDFSACDLELYFKALAADKKNIGNNLGCILTEGAGSLVRKQIPLDAQLKDLIRLYFTKMPSQ